MGTRADFYIGRGLEAEWLGSIAWDGYPGGITPISNGKELVLPGGLERFKSINWPEGEHLFDSKTADEYRNRLARFFERRDDVTLPSDGWPWPWNDSRTTDYSYALDEGKVYGSCFGYEWFDPHNEPDGDDHESKTCIFPDMTDRANTTFGPRSGIIILGAP